MLHKPESKIRVTAENNVTVFNTGVPAPIPDNYYTVQHFLPYRKEILLPSSNKPFTGTLKYCSHKYILVAAVVSSPKILSTQMLIPL
jgi:hypothetical protein